MEEGFLRLPLNSSTRLPSAESEPPLQFLFVNELEEKNASSGYGFAVRSHIRKRIISERRRRKALPKLHPQRLLPRASSGRRVDVDTLRNDSTSELVHLMSCGDVVITPGSPTRSDLNQRALEDQSRTVGVEEPRDKALYNPRDRIVGPLKHHEKEREACRRTLGGLHGLQQASFKRHGFYQAEANLHAHRMRPAGTNVASPASILGAGKIDPFRSYPADADRHEHWLIDYYTAVMTQPFPEDKQNGYTLLLTKFVPYCLTHKMAFKSILLSAETHSRGMAGLVTMSPRAIKLSMEIYALLNEELGKPDLLVTDAMIATVINVAGVELHYGRQRSRCKGHLRGLRQLVKLRGGLNNLTPDGFLKDLVIWCHQMGGEFLVTGTHGADAHVSIQEDHNFRKPLIRRVLGSPLISKDMIEILRSIRRVMLTQTSSNNTASTSSSQSNDLNAACVGIKQQLQALKSESTTASLEQACLLSAEIYVDRVLLNVPFKELFKSDANLKLQEAIMRPRKTAEEVEDNKEILEWIVSVQGMNVGLNESEVVEKFHNMVTQLEVVGI